MSHEIFGFLRVNKFKGSRVLFIKSYDKCIFWIRQFYEDIRDCSRIDFGSLFILMNIDESITSHHFTKKNWPSSYSLLFRSESFNESPTIKRLTKQSPNLYIIIILCTISLRQIFQVKSLTGSIRDFSISFVVIRSLMLHL